ncbi:DUF2231 domain-containing protein [Flavobacterium geliluteum]|uniref:DUF2231 domain-containing protein n=1 Tax=Flavobacterium geliluteum TaxID=2816120 RepID=A0A941AZC5_9FLAO|nr:DUF2231 domain-containing protein [Flavobacterium geliluteum]MBP4138807.1 hypothetical protein [Flavobacterium geliluteum]
MNEAHYHLVLNHFPIILPIVGLMVIIGGFIVKSEIIKRTAYCIFIFGALAAFAAMATGEGAEEVVEHMDGISKSIIHEHEEKAELLALLSYVLGIISVLALWSNWKRKSYSNYVAYAVIVCSFIVLFFAQQTGTTGGEIRHSEIR